MNDDAPHSNKSAAPRIAYEGKYLRMVERGTWEYSERTHAGGLAAIIIALATITFVAGWLAGIIVNLVSVGAYYDVALRDFGLLVGALALAALAFDRNNKAA